MKIVIIDDEPTARSLIRHIISRENAVSYEIFEAADLLEGVAIIKAEKPKLVFLDIEMPNQQGIEIFSYFEDDEIDFEIVFCTAYSDYAINAFEMNAIDYILKPVRPNRIIEVLKKVETSFNQKQIQMRLHELKESLRNQQFRKIGVPVNDGIVFIPIENIVYLMADGMYTNIHRVDGKTLTVSKPLKYFNRLIGVGMPFYRPHRSYIINLHFLKQYVKRDGNYILLDNDEMIPLSKEKKDEFLLLISDL